MTNAAEIFGDFIKTLRMEKRFTLRKFCVANNLDSTEISKLERGRIKPPEDTYLKKIATHLGLTKGSDGWSQFFKLAEDARNSDIREITDEELVGMVPVYFRKTENSDYTKEELLSLAETIRNS